MTALNKFSMVEPWQYYLLYFVCCVFNSELTFRISSDGKAPASWLHEKWSTIILKQAEHIQWDLLGKCTEPFVIKSPAVYFSLVIFIQLHESEIEICNLRLKFVISIIVVTSLHTYTQKHTQVLLEKICLCCVRQRQHIAELIMTFGGTFFSEFKTFIICMVDLWDILLNYSGVYLVFSWILP